MEDWKEVKLGDLCYKVCSGGTPKSTCSAYYEGGKIPWLNTKEINYNKIYETESHITEDGLNNSSAKWIDANAVIVAMYGATAGRVAISKIPLTTNQACCNLMIDSSKADYEYIYYYLSNSYKQLLSMANGAAQQNLNAQVIKDFVIPLPNLEVQQNIASILSSLDSKIEYNYKICKKLEAQAQALFKHWFIDFAPFKNGKFVESELGMIPEGWKVGKLSELIEEIESGSRPKGGAKAEGVPSIGAEKIEKFGYYDYSSEKYISHDYYANMKRGHVKDGDVLLYKDGAYTGKSSMVLDGFPYNECAVNEHVFLLRTESSKYQFFLYFLISYPKNKTMIHTLASAKAAQPGLNQKELLGLDIVIPDEEIIKKFNDLISLNMHQIANKANESRCLSTLRDTLLPKLMSGQIKI